MSESKFIQISFEEAVERLNKGEYVYAEDSPERKFKVLEGFVREQDLATYPNELGAVNLQGRGVCLVYKISRFVREVKLVKREYREGDDLASVVGFPYGKIVHIQACPKLGHIHALYIHRVTETLEHIWLDEVTVSVYE